MSLSRCVSTSPPPPPPAAAPSSSLPSPLPLLLPPPPAPPPALFAAAAALPAPSLPPAPGPAPPPPVPAAKVTPLPALPLPFTNLRHGRSAWCSSGAYPCCGIQGRVAVEQQWGVPLWRDPCGKGGKSSATTGSMSPRAKTLGWWRGGWTPEWFSGVRAHTLPRASHLCECSKCSQSAATATALQAHHDPGAWSSLHLRERAPYSLQQCATRYCHPPTTSAQGAGACRSGRRAPIYTVMQYE